MKEKKLYCVCGGGHQGLAMAAYLALHGERVSLWNRTLDNIKKIKRDRKIYCSGVVNDIAVIEKASEKIEEVISDYILVTVPSTAYADVAKLISKYVDKNTTIVLNPGRTFGAIEFAEKLKQYNVKEMPQIAETQTIVYTCRRKGDNEVTIFAMKNNVEIAALVNTDINKVLLNMPKCLANYFVIKKNIAYTSFANVGMILHCAPVLMNIGWIENDKVAFKYYYEGISQSVARYLEKMDCERVHIAEKMGYKVETVCEWLGRTYGVTGNNLYECIKNNHAYEEIDAPPSLNTRYILEDVPNGLVPIEDIGKQINVQTTNTTLIIELANSVYETDFRKIGRTFSLDILNMYLGK